MHTLGQRATWCPSNGAPGGEAEGVFSGFQLYMEVTNAIHQTQ